MIQISNEELIEKAKSVLKPREIKHGFTVGDVGCARAVVSIVSGGPADEAGLQVGDIIKDVNGLQMNSEQTS